MTISTSKSMTSRGTRGLRPQEGRVWDAVCVGSGMGSLAAAAALAKFGRSVLVLESHGQLGGLTHTFRRKQHRWGSGLHYTGWPTAYPCDFPELWETLTEGQAPWTRLPEETDRYIRPDGEFTKRAPRELYREDLHSAFPRERNVIDRYLGDMRRINQDFIRFMTLQALPRGVERLGPRWWLGRKFLAMDKLPVIRYMDEIGASERLREHLWFTWGNFGGVPSETSIGAYAVPNEFMHDGMWTPTGGSRSVADAFAGVIRRAGGDLRTRAEVTGLVMQGGRAGGVEVGGEVVRARTVISGIGARETYRRLIPEEFRPEHAARISELPSSCSIFTLYLALERKFLERHGLNGVNYWVEFEPGSMRGVWTDLTAPPNWLLLSLAPRFHQDDDASDTVTAEVFVGVKGDQFARWQGSRVMKRGPDYDELKQRMVELTMDRVEQAWPGFRSSVRYCEGASPLSIASYTGHIHGAAYGIAPVPGRFSDRALRIQTGVPGLLLTGQDISVSGIVGAFYGGLTAASAVNLRDAGKSLLRSRGRLATS